MPVAKISKPFGFGGEVIINLYDGFPEDFQLQNPLFVNIDSLEVPLFFDKFERRGRGSALVAFADFDTPSRVSGLLGKELSVGKEPVNDGKNENEIYLEDFIGFTARLKRDGLSGVIIDFIDNEHNPLFVLSIDDKEVYIPASDNFIDKFNLKKKEVSFSLPEGLLELYL